MTESVLSFYTTKRVTRFLFLSIAVLIAICYVVVNRMLMSRSEEAVSYEVALLLTVLISTAPFIYHVVAQSSQKSRSRLPNTLEIRTEIHLPSGRILLDELKSELSSSTPLESEIRRLANLTVKRQRYTIVFTIAIALMILPAWFLFKTDGQVGLVLTGVLSGLLSVLISAMMSRRLDEELLRVLIDLAAKTHQMKTTPPLSKRSVFQGYRTATRERY